MRDREKNIKIRLCAMNILLGAIFAIALAFSCFMVLVIKPIVTDLQYKIISVASMFIFIPLWFFMKIRVNRYLRDRADKENNNLES